jgi:hypothetical protein
MTILSCMTHFLRIGTSLIYFMMQFSLHFASIWHSTTKFNGQISRNEWLLARRSLSSRVVLDSLMGHSLMAENLGIMLPMGHGSMGRKRCIMRIARWLWTIMDYSFTWILVTQIHFMMSPSYTNQNYTNIDTNFLCILMSILSIY